jgi:hypothetical protein
MTGPGTTNKRGGHEENNIPWRPSNALEWQRGPFYYALKKSSAMTLLQAHLQHKLPAPQVMAAAMLHLCAARESRYGSCALQQAALPCSYGP